MPRHPPPTNGKCILPTRTCLNQIGPGGSKHSFYQLLSELTRRSELGAGGQTDRQTDGERGRERRSETERAHTMTAQGSRRQRKVRDYRMFVFRPCLLPSATVSTTGPQYNVPVVAFAAKACLQQPFQTRHLTPHPAPFYYYKS